MYLTGETFYHRYRRKFLLAGMLFCATTRTRNAVSFSFWWSDSGRRSEFTILKTRKQDGCTFTCVRMMPHESEWVMCDRPSCLS
ncbi:uncharacterized protein EV420DRAFT_1129277 [Desarmillaria tabescens]|uniref:Uncharacterized protein n=1 Tax=Armillaria tabescens TaxID=1929756 RepID=A0AA39JFK0_ARMTA|nr:uncharacterized protein EV420DRAFT_1129277 [Desarmillaria tabescens]KAK0440876.1 hypothetical protein EV420DRAFT_1129277 [Desarmillaria tabescens]